MEITHKTKNINRIFGSDKRINIYDKINYNVINKGILFKIISKNKIEVSSYNINAPILD